MRHLRSTICAARSTRTRAFCQAPESPSVAREAIIAEGCSLERCEINQSIIGVRTNIQAGTQIRRSVLLGADLYEADHNAARTRDNPRLGIGRDVVLDRVIVDKHARVGDGAKLVNEQSPWDYDGEGYYIRSGIIVVPKGAVIQPGMTLETTSHAIIGHGAKRPEAPDMARTSANR